MKNLSHFIQKAKDAGFEEVYHIMCPTPEYTLDTPFGIARRMNWNNSLKTNKLNFH